MQQQARIFRHLSLVLVASGFLSGCASGPERSDDAAVEYDPLESFNRNMYAFNTTVDDLTTKPLAKGYRKVTPTFVRQGVSNFYDNLLTPSSVINNFLQAKPARGFNELGRFIFNSTLGLGGLIDIAGMGGMDQYWEDFSQTFAVWGLPEGPYVMLPFIGPSSMLQTVALPFDYYADLARYIGSSSTQTAITVGEIIDLRYRLLPVDTVIDSSNDPYIAVREAFRQNREYEIHDGDPPNQDDYYEFSEEDDL
jgi:phospholipid-binding lipoprotein MlaA